MRYVVLVPDDETAFGPFTSLERARDLIDDLCRTGIPASRMPLLPAKDARGFYAATDIGQKHSQ